MSGHINPYAHGLYWDGQEHGGPPWRGFCIGGLSIRSHTFRRGVTVTGVFGNVGNRPGLMQSVCKNPVLYRCRLERDGKILPFWWLACASPEHQKNAGVIEQLDSRGMVVKTFHITESGMVTLEDLGLGGSRPELGAKAMPGNERLLAAARSLPPLAAPAGPRGLLPPIGGFQEGPPPSGSLASGPPPSGPPPGWRPRRHGKLRSK